MTSAGTSCFIVQRASVALVPHRRHAPTTRRRPVPSREAGLEVARAAADDGSVIA